jgi:hypothetical protein
MVGFTLTLFMVRGKCGVEESYLSTACIVDVVELNRG